MAGIYNASGPQQFTFRELAEAIADLTGTTATSITAEQAESAMGPMAALLQSSARTPSRKAHETVRVEHERSRPTGRRALRLLPGREPVSPSLASRALVGLLRVTGVKKRQFKPSRFLTEVANPSPPRLPGVTVRREEVEGWPVYRLTPGNPVKHYALYVHGGAWAAPITTQHWRLAARIAVESGREVALPLYPRLPAATHADVLPVMRGLFQQVQGRGPTALIGDSAGANIALSVLQALTPRGERRMSPFSSHLPST